MSRAGIVKCGKTWKVDTYVNGHPVKKGGFRTAGLAAEWLAKLKTDHDALVAYVQRRITGRRVTVAMAWAKFMRGHGSRVRRPKLYEGHGSHLLRLLGDMPAVTLRQSHVDDYRATRLEEGVAPKTVDNELGALRTALRYAWRNDVISAPPKFIVAKTKCARTRVVVPAEIRALLMASDLDLKRVVFAAYTCGLRRGEILAARWSWFNRVTRVLTIPASASKNGKEVTSKLPEMLVAMLDQEPKHPEWMWCRWRAGTSGRAKDVDVVGWKGSVLAEHWAKLCKRCGMPGLRMHDLRRSMSTEALKRKHSIAAVQAAGRWEDRNVMLTHYSHAQGDEAAAVAEDLAQLALGEAPPPSQTVNLDSIIKQLQVLAGVKGGSHQSPNQS